MNDEFPPIYVKEFSEVFDRFTFDYLFKRLLSDGYDHEDAKAVILYNCSLSTLVMQERLYNKYYLKLRVDSGISPDLMELYREDRDKRLFNEN
jgi:hypothetical protein